MLLPQIRDWIGAIALVSLAYHGVNQPVLVRKSSCTYLIVLYFLSATVTVYCRLDLGGYEPTVR